MRKLIVLSILAFGLTAPPAAGGGDVTVTASGISFTPKTVTISIGDSVEWINPNSGTHNVKFEDGQFETPADPSTSWPAVERTFGEAGSYAYYCELHGPPNGNMSGVVIVEDPALVPPTTELTKPIDGRTYLVSKTSTFRGTASDPSGPITEVEVALRRKKTNGLCGWWDGDSFVAGPCSGKQFQPANGTDTWSFSLGTIRLRPSRGTTIANYTMYSHATDADENLETHFERGRNVATFEVKKDP